MASRGNQIESWSPQPLAAAPNANVMNSESMTSPEAQAARARSAEIMAALKKGQPGDADKLMGPKQNHESMLPGLGKLKAKVFGGRTKSKDEGKLREKGED